MSVFFSNANGLITGRILDTVSQGSAMANPIVFVAPFPNSSVVTVAFKLPNGITTKPMVLAQETLHGYRDVYGDTINAWSGVANAAVAQYSGSVQVQFFVYSAYTAEGNSANSVLATVSDTITVNKGVQAEMPAVPEQDVYDQILTNLAILGGRVDNLEADVENARAFADDLSASIIKLNTQYDGLTLKYEPLQHLISLHGVKYLDGSAVEVQLGSAIDLPLESAVVGGRFDEDTHELILVLQGGEEVYIPLNDITEGLVNTSQVVQTMVSPSATTIPSTAAVKNYGDQLEHTSEEMTREVRYAVNQALESLTFDGTTLQFAQGVPYPNADSDAPEDVGEVTIPIDEIERRLDSIAEWIFGVIGTIVTVTDTYSRRTTAGGLDVADATETKVESIQGSTRFSNNLIDIEGLLGGAISGRGFTISANNNTVTLTGTPVSASSGYATWTIATNPSFLQVGKTYTFYQTSGVNQTYGNPRFGLRVWEYEGDNTTPTYKHNTSYSHFQVNVVEGYRYVLSLEADSFATDVEIIPAVTVSFMVCEGATKIPYEPFNADPIHTTFEGIKSTGRNLIDIEGLLGVGASPNGFTATANNNTVSLGGRPTGGYGELFRVVNPSFLQVGRTYTAFQTPAFFVSGEPSFGLRLSVKKQDGSNALNRLTAPNPITFTVVDGYRYTFILEAANFPRNVDVTDPHTTSIMLCEGSSALPYVPYVESEITLADATTLACNDTIDPKEQVLTRASKTIVFDGTADNGGIGYWEATATQAPKGVFRFYTNDANYRIAVNAHLAPSVSNLGYTSVSTIPDNADYVYELINVGSTPTQFWVKNSNFADADPTTALSKWLAYLTALNTAGTPLTIVYKGENAIRESAIIGDSYEVWNGGTESIIGEGEVTVEQSYIENAVTA